MQGNSDNSPLPCRLVVYVRKRSRFRQNHVSKCRALSGGKRLKLQRKGSIMKTKKKITISVISIFLAVLLVFCVVVGVNHYKAISKTGLQDTIPYGFGKEATVVLLAGQSNAAGCSRDEYLQKNVSAEKYAEYKKGYDNVYINHFASATNQSNAFVPCGACQGEYGGFFGPELGLAEKLNELYPDRTFFVIKYAWGGTNLYEQWRSPSSGGAVGPLYQSFVQYVKTSLEYLTVKNYKIKIEAMCWMQGESDSMEEEHALNYEKHLSNFVKDIRAELSSYQSNDGIAFVDAYIAETIFWKHYVQLNKAKQAVADSSPINVVIDTITHGLSVIKEPEEQPDIAHYDSLSELKLGNLFAEECAAFFD